MSALWGLGVRVLAFRSYGLGFRSLGVGLGHGGLNIGASVGAHGSLEILGGYVFAGVLSGIRK